MWLSTIFGELACIVAHASCSPPPPHLARRLKYHRPPLPRPPASCVGPLFRYLGVCLAVLISEKALMFPFVCKTCREKCPETIPKIFTALLQVLCCMLLRCFVGGV